MDNSNNTNVVSLFEAREAFEAALKEDIRKSLTTEIYHSLTLRRGKNNALRVIANALSRGEPVPQGLRHLYEVHKNEFAPQQ